MRLAPLPFLALLCTLTLAAHAAEAPATAPKPALLLTATAQEKSLPGEKVTVTLTITNTTDAPLTIDIPSMWWAQSDNPAVAFPKWPARGGVGPVMTFKSQIIEPGKSFTRTWDATITPPAEAILDEGMEVRTVAFKIGIPLKRGGETLWSDRIVVMVVGKM